MQINQNDFTLAFLIPLSLLFSQKRVHRGVGRLLEGEWVTEVYKNCKSVLVKAHLSTSELPLLTKAVV